MKKIFAFRMGPNSAVRYSLPVALAALLVPCSRADETGFFRIVGPVPTTLTVVAPDGIVTWTNAATNATFTVQTATILPGESNWVDWVQVPVSNAVTVHRIFDPSPPSGMTFIPAGSFVMGATTNVGHESISDAVPQHTVYVSAFYMDKYKVTKALWDEVYQWATNQGYNFEHAGYGKAANHPVHSINWYDMVKWCNARSEKEGRLPAYYISAAQTTVYRTGPVDVQNEWVKWNSGYRLPTEAEWEKAARGGSSGRRFPWGDMITHSQANYYSDSFYAYDVNSTNGYHPTFATGGDPYTSPVGYFAPNGYGLYDMAGNVFERCWDWYLSTYYSSSPGADPRGPAGSASDRVLRGGVWSSYAYYARCANRDFNLPDNSNPYFGFRCVRGL